MIWIGILIGLVLATIFFLFLCCVKVGSMADKIMPPVNYCGEEAIANTLCHSCELQNYCTKDIKNCDVYKENVGKEPPARDVVEDISRRLLKIERLTFDE